MKNEFIIDISTYSNDSLIPSELIDRGKNHHSRLLSLLITGYKPQNSSTQDLDILREIACKAQAWIKENLSIDLDIAKPEPAKTSTTALSAYSTFIRLMGNFPFLFIFNYSKRIAEIVYSGFIEDSFDTPIDKAIIKDSLNEFTNVIIGNSLSLIGKGTHIEMTCPATISFPDMRLHTKGQFLSAVRLENQDKRIDIWRIG